MSSEEVRAVPLDGELLRNLVDEIPAMLAFWDSTLVCRFANRAYERWLGVSPESLIGTHIAEFLGPQYQFSLLHIQGALRGEPQEFERELPNPSGGPARHSLVNYVPNVVHGVVHGFFVLVTDITEIKRAERALRESEERFRLIINEAPIGMALVSPDGRIVRANRALSDIVGYTREELTRLSFREITHPEDLDVGVVLAGQLFHGAIPRYTVAKRYIKKHGEIVDVMINASALRAADGTPSYFIVQIEDVTERKRLEDELRLAEAKSSGILSISADAIISIDQQQRITMFNQGAEEVFGYSSGEVIGASLDILIPERFRVIHRQHVAAFATGPNTARKERERDREIFGLRKNGQEFPTDAAISKLDVGGKPVLTVALRDITEQKRIEKEQKFFAQVGPVLADTLDHEETLARIAELAVKNVADLCIVELRDEDGNIRRHNVASRNPAQAGLCEWLKNLPLDRRRSYLMRSVFETGHPLLLERPSAETIASLSQSEEHLRALQAAEIRSVVAVPLVAHGTVLGAIAFVSSTDARIYGPADVQLAEGLAQRAALAIDNARLYGSARRAARARDDVLAVVAHDLRNPLNTILIQADQLRLARSEPERRSRRAADIIERNAKRMNRLIQDLLDVASMEDGRLTIKPTCVPAIEVVNDSVEAQRPLADSASLELRLDVAEDLPEVCVDRERLLQVFENLIGNAVKFTRPEGNIAVGAAQQDGEVLFWVADTGTGIEPGDVPHLFDRFWQAGHAEGRGSGLGLPIAKGIIEAHHGRIWVESTPGKGSSFYFALPAAHRPAH